MGTNVQDRAVALHHLDCPWRPADLAQHDGQALRDQLTLAPSRPGSDPSTIRSIAGLTFDATVWRTKQRTGYELTIADIPQGAVEARRASCSMPKPSSLPIRMENRIAALDKNLANAHHAHTDLPD